MINTVYFTALLFVFLRILSFVVIVPIFTPKGLPNVTKIAFAGILSFMIVSSIDYSVVNSINNNYLFIYSCAQEIVTGLTLGFIVNLCFSIIKMAGQLMDIQIGLAMVSTMDPSTNTSSTLIENLLYWFAVVLFFSVDGHLMLIQQLIDSFKAVKIGHCLLSQDSIMIIVQVFVKFFIMGLKIAIPVVLIIIITDITLGLIARTVPQLNIMILGLPIKILVGLGCISIALPLLAKLIMSSYTVLPDVIKSIYKYAPLMLIFASEDKTEDPTDKKLSDARKKGQVAKSKEVNLAFTLLASTLVLSLLGGFSGKNILSMLSNSLGQTLNTKLSYGTLMSIYIATMIKLAFILLPLILPIMVMGVAGNFVQVGFLNSTESLKPQFSRINPISGFKRIFSMRTLMSLFKDLAIVIVPAYMGYKFVMDNYNNIMSISSLDISQVIPTFGGLVISIFIKITIFMILVAAIDFFYQKYTYKKDLRMTKQEIKEEYKQQEGDPQIKSKIRQKQREMSSARMMQKVPEATVVITNPTHVAIALKYEEGEGSAPILVAKGLDRVALKIKEIAKENDIPMIENKPLARLLYEKVDLDSEIPADMYQAVAEILALVYKLKRK